MHKESIGEVASEWHGWWRNHGKNLVGFRWQMVKGGRCGGVWCRILDPKMVMVKE